MVAPSSELVPSMFSAAMQDERNESAGAADNWPNGPDDLQQPLIPRQREAIADMTDKEAKALVANMPTAVLKCRKKGHRWGDDPVDVDWDDDRMAWKIIYLCERCDSTQYQWESARGSIIDTTIDYAPGYLVEGHGRFIGTARDVLRVEVRTRFQSTKKQAGKDKKKSGRVA